MAGLTIIIIFLLFQHLSRHKESLNTDLLQIDSLKDRLDEKETEIRKVGTEKDRLQRQMQLFQDETDNLKKELAEKDKFCRDLTAQLEQQKQQFMQQVIKYKKLEKDLEAKRDEANEVEQENQKLRKEKELLGKELEQIKGELERLKKEPQQTEQAKTEQVPGLEKEEQKPQRPEPEEPKPKDEQKPPLPQEGSSELPEKPKQEQKPPSSPFNRFLKPKINKGRENKNSRKKRVN